MADQPYVVVSCAVSVDGYLDDASPHRLVLSDPQDWDRVDEVRAGCDAILVGATTIRRDNPRLLIRSPLRRAERAGRGHPVDLIKVTMTRTGRLDPTAQFFTTGAAAKLVYCPQHAEPDVRSRLGEVADVVGVPGSVDLAALLADLTARGVRRLLVEGGGEVLTRFLAADVVHELQLAVAPFFVADPQAPRWVGAGPLPVGPTRPMRLLESTRIGDMVVLRYALTAGEAG
jgi:riboflavin-specific deaminase-like protein